jgi:hippurate hydrolase
MTTWLGLAKFFSTHTKNWKGTIVFLAQSAEETAQGAKAIVAADAFTKLPKADLQLAIHNHAELPVGTFGFCHGFSMAAVDMMDITIFGKGGHGAAPQNTIDPVVLSAQYINAIQTIVSRNLSSNDPAVITVGSIHGGTIGNVVPDQVQLKLTIRSYSESSRKIILQRLKDIGDNLARAAGLTDDRLPQYKLLDMSIPAVFNNAELGERMEKILKTNFGDSAIKMIKPVMIGEDFSIYGQRNIPSYIIWTGTIANQERLLQREKNPLPSLHSALFTPDAEAAIRANITMLTTLLMELMKN